MDRRYIYDDGNAIDVNRHIPGSLESDHRMENSTYDASGYSSDNYFSNTEGSTTPELNGGSSTNIHVDANYDYYTSSGYPPLRLEDYYGYGNGYAASPDGMGIMSTSTGDNASRTNHVNPKPFDAPLECLYTGCDKSFKRRADLDRHYEQKHTPVHTKQYMCDYPKCSRRDEPFHRLDHYRDHFRDFHREDLPRRARENRDWYNDRSYTPGWWRCPKCLERRYVAMHGWDCQICRLSCDTVRRQKRESMY